MTFDREEDGRWIAEIEALPGCLAYGATQEEAAAKCQRLAADIILERHAGVFQLLAGE